METFYTIFLRLVPETLPVSLDVPRLVSEFYSNWLSLKPFISLVIRYKILNTCKLPAKTEIPFFWGEFS